MKQTVNMENTYIYLAFGKELRVVRTQDIFGELYTKEPMPTKVSSIELIPFKLFIGLEVMHKPTGLKGVIDMCFPDGSHAWRNKIHVIWDSKQTIKDITNKAVIIQGWVNMRDLAVKRFHNEEKKIHGKRLAALFLGDEKELEG